MLLSELCELNNYNRISQTKMDLASFQTPSSGFSILSLSTRGNNHTKKKGYSESEETVTRGRLQIYNN